MLRGASFTVDASPQSEKVSWIWQEVLAWRIKQRNIMSYHMEQSSFLYRQKELRRQKKKAPTYSSIIHSSFFALYLVQSVSSWRQGRHYALIPRRCEGGLVKSGPAHGGWGDEQFFSLSRSSPAIPQSAGINAGGHLRCCVWRVYGAFIDLEFCLLNGTAWECEDKILMMCSTSPNSQGIRQNVPFSETVYVGADYSTG